MGDAADHVSTVHAASAPPGAGADPRGSLPGPNSAAAASYSSAATEPMPAENLQATPEPGPASSTQLSIATTAVSACATPTSRKKCGSAKT